MMTTDEIYFAYLDSLPLPINIFSKGIMLKNEFDLKQDVAMEIANRWLARHKDFETGGLDFDGNMQEGK